MAKDFNTNFESFIKEVKASNLRSFIAQGITAKSTKEIAGPDDDKHEEQLDKVISNLEDIKKYVASIVKKTVGKKDVEANVPSASKNDKTNNDVDEGRTFTKDVKDFVKGMADPFKNMASYLLGTPEENKDEKGAVNTAEAGQSSPANIELSGDQVNPLIFEQSQITNEHLADQTDLLKEQADILDDHTDELVKQTEVFGKVFDVAEKIHTLLDKQKPEKPSERARRLNSASRDEEDKKEIRKERTRRYVPGVERKQPNSLLSLNARGEPTISKPLTAGSSGGATDALKEALGMDQTNPQQGVSPTDATSVAEQVAQKGKYALGAGAGVSAGILVGGAAASYGATGVLASEAQASNRKALQENSMLGAMSGDTAMAAGILDANGPDTVEKVRERQSNEKAALKDAPWYTRIYGVGKQEYLKKQGHSQDDIDEMTGKNSIADLEAKKLEMETTLGSRKWMDKEDQKKYDDIVSQLEAKKGRQQVKMANEDFGPPVAPSPTLDRPQSTSASPAAPSPTLDRPSAAGASPAAPSPTLDRPSAASASPAAPQYNGVELQNESVTNKELVMSSTSQNNAGSPVVSNSVNNVNTQTFVPMKPTPRATGTSFERFIDRVTMG